MAMTVTIALDGADTYKLKVIYSIEDNSQEKTVNILPAGSEAIVSDSGKLSLFRIEREPL